MVSFVIKDYTFIGVAVLDVNRFGFLSGNPAVLAFHFCTQINNSVKKFVDIGGQYG